LLFAVGSSVSNIFSLFNQPNPAMLNLDVPSLFPFFTIDTPGNWHRYSLILNVMF